VSLDVVKEVQHGKRLNREICSHALVDTKTKDDAINPRMFYVTLIGMDAKKLE
jgi:hypothetical protein